MSAAFQYQAVPFVPRLAQRLMIRFLLEHAAAGIFADVGVGKTGGVLAAFRILRRRRVARRMLVVAPLRVAHLVWPAEAAKWEEFSNLRVAVLHGRDRDELLASDADICVVNYEGLDWLLKAERRTSPSGRVSIQADLKRFRGLGFDTLVMDELTRVKHTTSGRHKALKVIAPTFARRWGLTGTPVPNGLIDLFGQVLCLDLGRSFSPYVTHFRREYFLPSYDGFGWVLQKGAEERIYGRLRPLVLRLAAADYVDMPALVENTVAFDLPPAARKIYDALEDDLIARVGEHTVIASNVAAASTKCIAADTEVLTDSGWKPIETLNNTNLVWDGVGWTSIDKSEYTGYRSVVECFGVRMTPDHKVLTASGWRQAQEVLSGKSGERHDRASVRLPYSYEPCGQQNHMRDVSCGMLEVEVYMRQRRNHDRCISPRHTAQTGAIVWVQVERDSNRAAQDTWYVKDQAIHNIVWNDSEMPGHQQQRLVELRWTRDKSLPAMADVRGVLEGYAGWLRAPSDDRPKRCEWPLQQEKLPLDYAGNSDQEPSSCRLHQYAKREDAASQCRGCVRGQICNAIRPDLPLGLDGEGLFQSDTKAHVYDLINAGPRQRFTVRGADGIPLIIHNCRQVANGAIYLANLPPDDPIRAKLPRRAGAREFAEVHDAKLEALGDLVEELQGQPLLVAYDFRHDLDRLRKRFNAPAIGGGTSTREAARLEAQWNRGEIPVLLGHPASIGHGLNLQGAGNHVAFYGLPWDLELHDQFIGRVRRQGLKHDRVFVHYLLARDTVDETICWALRRKGRVQDALLAALRKR